MEYQIEEENKKEKVFLVGNVLEKSSIKTFPTVVWIEYQGDTPIKVTKAWRYIEDKWKDVSSEVSLCERAKC